MKHLPRRLYVKINSAYFFACSLVCLLQFGLYVICFKIICANNPKCQHIFSFPLRPKFTAAVGIERS